MEGLLIYVPEELNDAFGRELSGKQLGYLGVDEIQREITNIESTMVSGDFKDGLKVNVGPLYSELQAVYACRTGEFPKLNPDCVKLMTDCEISVKVADLVGRSDIFLSMFMRSVFTKLNSEQREEVVKVLNNLNK